MLNLDDPETRALAEAVPADKVIGYGFDSPGADFMGKDLQLLAGRRELRAARPTASATRCGSHVPGRHNASNALAAIAATRALGVPLEDAVTALARFEGLKRRLETVGEAGGVTVIDDFAHNPDKIDATLATLRAQPGRLLIMFQPHGYGPLPRWASSSPTAWPRAWRRTTGSTCPTRSIRAARSSGRAASDWLAEQVTERGGKAEHIPERAKIGEALVAEAQARRPHPDHGRARRHADRFRAGAGRTQARATSEP